LEYGKVGYGWTEFPDKALVKALEFGQKAIGLDESNSRAHSLLSSIACTLWYMYGEDPFPRYYNPQSVAGTSQPRQMNMGGMGAMFGGPQNIPKGDINQLWKALLPTLHCLSIY